MAPRIVENRRVGVAEGVNRLLAIADDEDRRRERTAGGETGAFTPRLHQQRDQLPLRPARVLELVDEHVVVARLQAIAALRELLHVAQQIERAQQQVREVEHGVRIERAPVFGLGDAVHPQDAARHEDVQVPFVARDGLLHRRRVADHEIAMRGPGGLADEPILVERALLARLAVLRQEIVACVRVGRLDRRGIERRVLFETPEILREQQEDMLGWTRREKPLHAAGHRGEHAEQRRDGSPRCRCHVEMTRPCRQVALEDARRHQPAVEQRGQTAAGASIAELREDERDVLVLAREDAARPQRAIERFVDETGHLCLIRDVEAGIEVRLQRKLAEQRQAEGVDGADGNLVDAVAQLTPASRRNLAALSRRAECRDNPLAHLGRGLACEGHGEDVRRIDAGAQQVDVAIDEHARLAGPRRRLERHVVARIDGALARLLVLVGRLVDVERQPRITRHRRNPSGTPMGTRSRSRSAPRADAAGTRRARSRRR